MHCCIQNIEALGHVVVAKNFFFSFPHYKSMEANAFEIEPI